MPQKAIISTTNFPRPSKVNIGPNGSGQAAADYPSVERIIWLMQNDIQSLAKAQNSSDIVESDLIAQPAAIVATPLFTPDATGLYRITAYAVCMFPGAGTLSTVLTWQDDVQSQQMNILGDLALTAKGLYVQGEAVIRAVSGNAVNYSTSIAGLGGGATYALFLHSEPA